ncbi:MAG: patatin-like phospholipase family protein [Solirubrobacterales bacterium]
MADDPTAEESPRAEGVALVLAGGGARGAYQAGVLAELIPELERRGEREVILSGASVGSINAVHLAATRHLGAQESVERCLELWKSLRFRDVMRPVLREGLPLTVLRYMAEAFAVPGFRLQGLFDAGPLEDTLNRLIDWDAVHESIESGPIEALSVMTTAVRTGQVTSFTDSKDDELDLDDQDVRYVAGRVTVDHVRASAAIPLVFAPIRVDEPEAGRGWYVDGSTRLQSPLEPAVLLGCDRILAIGCSDLVQRAADPMESDMDDPDMADGAVNALEGLLGDRIVADIRDLATKNRLSQIPAVNEMRREEGRREWEEIPWAFVAPSEPGEVGRLAYRCFRERYASPRGLLRASDLPLIHRFTGGESPLQGELLSLLMFDEEFAEESIKLGRRDAKRWLEAEPDLWRSVPLGL